MGRNLERYDAVIKERLGITQEEAREKLGYNPRDLRNWHVVILFFLFGFLICYLLIDDVFYGVNLVVHIIITDWQISLSILMIIGLTIGWYAIQGLSLFIFYMKDSIARRDWRKHMIRARFLLVIYFICILLTESLFSSMTFDNPLTYLVALAFGFMFTVIAIRLVKLKKWIDKKREKPVKIQQKEDILKSEEVSDVIIWNKYIPFILLGIIFVIAYFSNAGGFGDFINQLWFTLSTNAIMRFLFIMVLILTIFWGFIVIFVKLLIKLVEYILKTYVKKKINKARFSFFIFALVLLLSKSLRFVITDPFQLSLWGLILSLISSILSAFLLRRFSFIK